MRARMHDRQTMLRDLCRRHIKGDVIKRKRGIVEIEGKIIIPVAVNLHQRIIQAIHHSQGAFHLGVTKTRIIVDRYFWFNDMTQKVTRYVRACKQCQDGKRLPFQLMPELGQTSSYSRERLRTWAMDVIQMPKGHMGYAYILTCLDLATSWLEAWPLKRATADKVAEMIQFQLVPRYGEGLSFVCDQGKEFVAHVVKRAVKKTSSYIHYGTVYNSQSNPVERFHRTLEGVMRCLLIDRKQNAKQWPTVLADALRTMRSAPDATTKDSPFYRVFGMRPRIAAIEWMNIQREEGGFSFNPDAPSRPLDVDGPAVYPAKVPEIDLTKEEENTTKPDSTPREEDARWPDEKIEEDGMHAQVTFNGNTRLLAKLPRTQQQMDNKSQFKFYRQVFSLPLPPELQVQERAQRAKDVAVKEQHQRNAERKKKQFPKTGTWYAMVGELVDWREPVDPDNPNTRKMRNPYQGPYVVVNRDIQGKTVTIRKVDATTLEMERKQKIVHIGQVRPTLEFEFLTRPSGEDFDPSDLFDDEDTTVYETAMLENVSDIYSKPPNKQELE